MENISLNKETETASFLKWQDVFLMMAGLLTVFLILAYMVINDRSIQGNASNQKSPLAKMATVTRL